MRAILVPKGSNIDPWCNQGGRLWPPGVVCWNAIFVVV